MQTRAVGDGRWTVDRIAVSSHNREILPFTDFQGVAVVIRVLAGVFAAVAICFSATADDPKAKDKAKTPPTIGDKVVDFCKKNVGEQVGNGECWTLANNALLAAGVKSSTAYKDSPNKTDYVWGDLVFGVDAKDGKTTETGKASKVQPGDVVQFRDASFAGKQAGGGTYSLTASHHTAVVTEVTNDGKTVTVLHQNWAGKKTVTETTFQLDDLQAGWLKIYHPHK
jgi:hypothetical protein